MSLLGRTFRPKKHTMKFYCPLCRSERGMNLSPRPSFKNYIQMILTTVCIVLALYSYMGLRSLYAFFIVWGIFEFGIRYYCRKEIPCPYCGFDATWYKKDVNVAREIVEKFWQEREAEKNQDQELIVPEQKEHEDMPVNFEEDENFNDSLNENSDNF